MMVKKTNESKALQTGLKKRFTHQSEWRRVVNVFFGRKIAVVGLIIVTVLIIVAIFASQIAPYDPNETNISEKLLSPSWQHLLGTDSVGRDTFSRIVYGARTSLIVGIAAVGLSSIIGITLGLAAAYFGGWVNMVIMRLIDALMTLPSMVLILLIAGLVGGGIGVVIFALTLNSIATKTRMMCGQALTVMQSDYIMAGRSMGMSHLRMMLTQVLPNSFAPLLVIITMQFGYVILAEASLSFLGIGILPPNAAWGSMVNDGYKYIIANPILAIAPGVAIMLVVFGFNMMGDGLRDALDPKLRGVL